MNVSRSKSFTLVEVMIVVAVIGILASISIPNLTKARETAQKSTCLNNLRQIEAAKEQWAMANNKNTGDEADSDVIAAYIRGGFPNCPAEGAYTVNPIGTDASCSKHGTVTGTSSSSSSSSRIMFT